jgi:hypothetical protein
MQDKLKSAFLKGVESMNLEAMSAINNTQPNISQNKNISQSFQNQ